MRSILGIAVCLLMLIFPACEKKEVQEDAKQEEQLDSFQAKAASLFIESDVNTRFGKPGVTDFVFQVYDVSGTLALSVKFYERATGQVTYVPMIRIGNNWTLTKKMVNNGWFDWRYVYSITKANISSKAYYLCATYNTFNSSGVSSIRWPFGADGSSWTNRLLWIGACEYGGCGSCWNTPGHSNQGCNADDRFAEDWNKNCSNSADNGAEVRSPLDGEVVRVMTDSPTNHHGGYGNYIDVKQLAPDGKVYIFRVAHLKYAPTLSVGAKVKAGFTIIGYIGMSGGTSTNYHAHCALYVEPQCYTGVKFSFNAQ